MSFVNLFKIFVIIKDQSDSFFVSLWSILVPNFAPLYYLILLVLVHQFLCSTCGILQYELDLCWKILAVKITEQKLKPSNRNLFLCELMFYSTIRLLGCLLSMLDVTWNFPPNIFLIGKYMPVLVSSSWTALKTRGTLGVVSSTYILDRSNST